MTNSTESFSKTISNNLKRHRMIAIIWGIEDVQEVRGDLSDDQAWMVLQGLERNHDCEIGITWDVIEFFAEELFPISDA